MPIAEDIMEDILDLQNQMPDILKRLHSIENILLSMTDVIDMANNFEKRVEAIEHKLKGRNSTMESAKPQEAKKEGLSMSEDVIKQALLEKTYNLYGQLINYLKNIPVNQQAMQLAYQNLDQGIHWVEKILSQAKFNLTKVADEKTQPIPPKSETKPVEKEQEKKCDDEKANNEGHPENPQENNAAPKDAA